MLIITNGDSAADKIDQLGIKARILPWRDVLHDGPVPAKIPLEELSKKRAQFIADRGWGDLAQVTRDFVARDKILTNCPDEDEVVLWFEHDLYDQLQMCQIFEWFAICERRLPKISLICRDEYVAESSSARLQELFDSRPVVTEEQIAAGQAAWTAFRKPEPTGLNQIGMAKPSTQLPFLSQALRRHLEEFPDISNGLSRNERQIISNVAAGITTPAELFSATQKLENPKYLGDASFWLYIEDLTEGKMPLLRTGSGESFSPPSSEGPDREFLTQTLIMTPEGRQVLNNKLDWIEINGIDKWLGGVHLQPGNIWRWDSAQMQLVKN